MKQCEDSEVHGTYFAVNGLNEKEEISKFYVAP
jgi:hypothetical protein